MRRWLIGTIWRDATTPWSPGVSISTAPSEIAKELIMRDFILHQQALHPYRQFSERIYIVDLDEHLREAAAAPEAGGGNLEVGSNFKGEVVVNVPATANDTAHHLVFSVSEARALAQLLNDKAADAEAILLMTTRGEPVPPATPEVAS